MNFKTVVLVLLGVLAAGAHADGTLYRWVDASGGVHYSDQPVANAQPVEARPVPGTSAPAPTVASAAKPEDGASGQDCQKKRDQLGSYRNASKVTETDGLGNQHEYTPEQRQKLIEITEKAVHDACGGS